jgi:flavodoxin
MKTLIVYDSVFGNTEKIAQAIGRSLDLGGDVETRRVGEVKPGGLGGTNLLIVGSPTRAFRPTKAITAFLHRIPRGNLAGVRTAVFDTRIDVKEVHSAVLTFFASIFGFAAEAIAKRIGKKGGTPAAPPEGFIVTGSQGPLREGELDRAAQWAKRLANS